MRPFVLLQLSDLHFGPHSRFAKLDMGELARRCADAIREARGDLGWKEEVGLVLVTGDVAEAARPPEYKSALAFFEGLMEGLEVPRSSFVFVPGNHDVSWTKCKEVEGHLQDGLFEEEDFRARLDEVKLARFDDMVARFYDPSLPPHDDRGPGPARPAAAGSVTALSRGAYVHDFEALSVSVAALDSCEVESHHAEDHHGLISKEQAQAVLSHWRDDTTPANRIRIMAVHHNPVPTIPKAIREWREWLRSQVEGGKLKADLFEHFAADAVGFEGHERLQALAADAQVSLLFHGHHHASDAVHAWAWRGRGTSGDTRVISAGSWSLIEKKLPAEQPVVMQLVRVEPAVETVQPVLLRYEPRARAKGVVEPGTFVLDEVTRSQAVVGLSLPASMEKKGGIKGPTTTSASPPASGASAAAAFMAAYHARKRNTFVRWDLRAVGAVPTVGNNRPVEVNLDDMYIPLRFGEKYDLQHLRSGTPIDADRLLGRETPLVIIGNAGSGKTTWMQRTFRQFIQTRTAVPFFLELRAVAASWEKRSDAERTIEALLADEMKVCGARWDTALAELLDGRDGPRPVLLVDGWDEMGDLGERLRKCLSEFSAAHRRAVIVVSSRPYGESRPAGSEGFETLEIQPLSDADVRLLTHRFHRRVHGEEEVGAERSTGDFMNRLAAVPEAQALGRTALLLTMMLLLSREGPLPDKRHKLYLACLRNLLDARPALRESEGAQLRHNEWRPSDQEARLRAVSEMAYRMQNDGYKKMSRGPIVRPWQEASQLLPGAWTRKQREGFLLWLVNSAGVLVDRSDGAISFAHLSFQEFLAAHFLFATHEGKARITAALAHASDPDWWETLRLWAGLTGDLSPEKLSPVLTALHRQPHSFWLAGSILADGSGQPADFEAWRQDVCGRMIREMWPAGRQCARAWATSKQQERRDLLTEAVAASTSSAHWLDGVALADWSESALLEVALAPTLLEMLDSKASELALARTRVVADLPWQLYDLESTALLRLWPSGRSRISLTLQTLASLGANYRTLLRVARSLVRRIPRFARNQEVSADIVNDTASRAEAVLLHNLRRVLEERKKHDVRNVVHGITVDAISYVLSHFGDKSIRILQVGNLFHSVVDVANDLMTRLRRRFARGLKNFPARDFVDEIYRGTRQDFAALLAAAWGVKSAVTSTVLWADFALVEISSTLRRAAVRAMFAHGKFHRNDPGELHLLQLACRVSLGYEPASRRLDDRAACYRGDPLWPALARHVARVSTADDRALLENAVARPEQRDSPISWALRYYVRGDIVMNDGTVITMDEICDELGVSRLPLLDDMPPEIEVDFVQDR